MRKIYISVEARVITDNPKLLGTIAESLPKDDLNIDIKGDSAAPAQRDDILEIQVHHDAKTVLDANEEANYGKIREPVAKEVVQSKLGKWGKVVLQEGGRIVIKEGFGQLAEEFSKFL